jgi:hypothetical protein
MYTPCNPHSGLCKRVHNRKISVAQMEEDEFEKILQVLQKDFELRQKEQQRLR